MIQYVVANHVGFCNKILYLDVHTVITYCFHPLTYTWQVALQMN